MKQYTDILIVGGGSSGFGAAYRILCHGKYTVTLVEPNPGLGGTSTYGGINCWEPGYSGHGVHHVLAELLQKEGSGFVGKTYVFASDLTPWGRSGPCSDPYEETLIRSFRTETEQRRFHFEPEAMAYTMLKLLHCADSAQKATCLFHSRVTAVETTGRRITAITAETPEGPRTIIPKLVLDCTGDRLVPLAAPVRWVRMRNLFMANPMPRNAHNPLSTASRWPSVSLPARRIISKRSRWNTPMWICPTG